MTQPHRSGRTPPSGADDPRASDVEGSEPLVKPPALRTGQEASASRLELFFDLAYVLVVLELATTFLGDLTWHGLGMFAALFVAIWFSWVGFTLYANRFDTDDVVFRIAKLAATLAIAGCAASASAATLSFSTPFAASFLAGRIILLLLYARAWRHVTKARPTITVYLGTTAVSSVLWAVSLGVDGTVRYLLWAGAVVVDAASPILATWREGQVPLHMEHLPERFGLFVILVLGEAVGGAATGVHDAKWALPAVPVGIAGFAIAAALWWNYFDITATDSVEKLQERDDQDSTAAEADADERHDLFVYGHLPLTFGIVMTGIGVEALVLHPDAALPSPGGWTLSTGIILFLAGSALITGGTQRSWRAVWPWPALAIPIVLAGAAVRHHTALLLVGGLALVCITLAAFGTVRRRSTLRAASPGRTSPPGSFLVGKLLLRFRLVSGEYHRNPGTRRRTDLDGTGASSPRIPGSCTGCVAQLCGCVRPLRSSGSSTHGAER